MARTTVRLAVTPRFPEESCWCPKCKHPVRRGDDFKRHVRICMIKRPVWSRKELEAAISLL